MTWRQRARSIAADVLVVPVLVGIAIAAVCWVAIDWLHEQMEREP